MVSIDINFKELDFKSPSILLWKTILYVAQSYRFPKSSRGEYIDKACAEAISAIENFVSRLEIHSR